MKLSRYTELFEGKDGYSYLFNCMTLKWIQIEKELADIFKLHETNIDDLREIHPDFYDALVSEEYLVKDIDDDINKCVEKIIKEYNSFDNLTITINPTLDCNLRCWYCYEKRHAQSVMSEETIKNTITFISNTLKSRNVKKLRLSFFGGEPMLRYKEVVKPIIAHIYDSCKLTSTKLSLTITTNGILLTDKTLIDLKKFSPDVNIQIAFDGSREFHNKVKHLGNHISCYDKSVQNAKKAIEMGFNVVVRCNYNKETIASFKEVIADFKDFHHYNNLRFLFQRIWQEKNDEELGTLWKKLINEIETNYSINSNFHKDSGHSLKVCYADFRNNIVINYDGNAYRCTARDFNTTNSIGKLNEDGCLIEKERDESKTIKGTSYGNICRQCRLLPICPSCSQARLECRFEKCPIGINPIKAVNNMKNIFQILTGIEVYHQLLTSK